ncbi:hypothetical protein Z945_17 [Sulfitobacter noctilucae]|nr:hypothetical protein Z945_17 [Sulfitobacter noctilucae]
MIFAREPAEVKRPSRNKKGRPEGSLFLNIAVARRFSPGGL